MNLLKNGPEDRHPGLGQGVSPGALAGFGSSQPVWASVDRAWTVRRSPGPFSKYPPLSRAVTLGTAVTAHNP